MLKGQRVRLEIQYKGCPMASDVLNIVHAKHLSAFRQVCRLLFRCAMADLAYCRTLSYPNVKLLSAIKRIKLLTSSFLLFSLLLSGL